MAEIKIEFVDNSRELVEALNENVEAILEAMGEFAEDDAVETITEEGRIDTGQYRNSITHTYNLGERAAYIGSNVPHAVWNEIGTGKYASEPGGRQTPWRYKDSKGNWHRTSGMKGIHALRNAAANHNNEYKTLIEKGLKGEL
jgi:hypothetical protein